MLSTFVWTTSALLVYFILNLSYRLAKNVQAAKLSGLKYVIVPFYSYYRPFSLFGGRLMRLADLFLPETTSDSPRWLVRPTWPWTKGYDPFARLKTDTFLTVAPGGIIMYTADADVISQITSRRSDFPKPTWLYRSVDIYGKNIVSSEGESWRQYRKLASPAFSERNNQLVWAEALNQTSAHLASWAGEGDRGRGPIRTLGADTMRLTLNVITRAGFGQQPRSDDKALPEGHVMSFSSALNYILSHILILILFPTWFLKASPTKGLRRCFDAYDEWSRHMNQILSAKKAKLKSRTAGDFDVDLVGQLLKGQESDQSEEKPGGQGPSLTDSEVIGNAFLFILAGHETTAGTLHVTLILLALNPAVQIRVQEQLDQIFRGRQVTRWEYERDLPPLFSGVLGAVLNEVLRLYGPVITIPKWIPETPQTLSVDGKRVTCSVGTMIKLCASSVHRNPKYWPSRQNAMSATSPNSPLVNDLDDFRPERWLCQDEADEGTSANNDKQTTITDHARSIFTPQKGAFLPFSLDHRACLGRRFAQVEIFAALATILSQQSVELSVDDWVNDADLMHMTAGERSCAWRKAEERGRKVLKTKMRNRITLQLRGGNVPLRFVKRGKEVFVGSHP